MGVGWPLRAPARHNFYPDLSPRRGVAGHWRADYPGNQSRQPRMQARARTRVARFVMPVNLGLARPAQKAQHIPARFPADFPSNNKARRAINTAGHKKEPPAQGPGVKSREEAAY